MSKQIVTVYKLTKSYNYQIDEVSLGFNLDPSNKKELSNFVVLLDQAKAEIEKDLKELE